MKMVMEYMPIPSRYASKHLSCDTLTTNYYIISIFLIATEALYDFCSLFISLSIIRYYYHHHPFVIYYTY